MRPTYVRPCTIALVLLTGISTLAAQEPADPPAGVARLSQQVWAMQMLHDFSLTAPQLRDLRALATDTADPRPDRKPGDAPAKYVEALRACRAALAKADNDDQITVLHDRLDELKEDEDIDLDDGVEITPAARTKAVTFLSGFGPTQVAGYIATFSDEAPEPVHILMEAMDGVRAAEPADVDATIKDAADELGILLSGLDPSASAGLREQITGLLKAVRNLSDDDYKTRHPQTESLARKLVGGTDAFTVLKHWVERDLAELLSNPMLPRAIADGPRPPE